jgi:hypothetical protein
VLRELHISGLGVIDDLDLELDPGLNVLTGETGAGKTMIAVGLALALGQRRSATVVREGAAAARVQARFDAPLPESAEAWTEDGELFDTTKRDVAKAHGKFNEEVVYEPLPVLVGTGRVIPGFDEALERADVGATAAHGQLPVAASRARGRGLGRRKHGGSDGHEDRKQSSICHVGPLLFRTRLRG